jgi:hypothetical protein
VLGVEDARAAVRDGGCRRPPPLLLIERTGARELVELGSGTLAPKYFYDERGSELFDQITESMVIAGVVDTDGCQSASRAQRKPLNSWRRIGRSQLRNVVVATRGRVAQEPPRSTL